MGNSAVLTNSGKRPSSPHWPIVAAVLIDSEEHKAAELREACEVDGDARPAGAKALGRENDEWIADGLIERHGKTANTTDTMTAAAMAVIDR
ncbi:hypothetical protein MTE01_25860 [Microbacterium testaceum]|uniref:Uncharacterized protein n=1 Tax=Microbacterium testaceum TaxID=2033 RepID=A0A4Y3QNC6_MICTE|nr:hypothetical protein MTE01_25860 [Microbacterium testaceum]